jgi:hypothetical protein
VSYSGEPHHTLAQKMGCAAVATVLIAINACALLVSAVPADCPEELAQCANFAFRRDLILFGTPLMSVLVASAAMLWMKRKQP